MKVSSVGGRSASFKAYLAQNMQSDKIREHFDSQIQPLQSKRDALLELDTFMHEKKVQDVLKRLPQEDELFVDYSKFDPDNMFLLYSPASEYSRKKFEAAPVKQAVNMAAFDIKRTSEGKIEKQKITQWLSNLSTFLGK